VPAHLVRVVSPDLALLGAAIDDPSALGRVLGCEAAEGWDVAPKVLRLTGDAVVADAEVAPSSKRRGVATAAVLCEAVRRAGDADKSSCTAWSIPAARCVLEKAGLVHHATARSGALKMSARCYGAGCVSAAGTFVRLPTAGRWA
jgi:hypothetical protein